MSGPPPASPNLDRQVLGGLAWTAGSKWLTQGVSWASVLILARLLQPGDFGLVDMAGVIFIVANVLAELGIGTAVVQLRSLTGTQIEQLNTTSVIISFLVCALVVALSPFTAWFFNADKLLLLIPCYSVSLLLAGFQSIPNAVLRRDLKYKHLSVAEGAQSIFQATVTVAMAGLGFSYWSLVIGQLAGKALSTALSIIWTRVHYRVPVLNMIRGALVFGGRVSVDAIAGTLANQVGTVVVGKRLGSEALGQYGMTLNLAFSPADKAGGLITRVTGPLFARVQSDNVLLSRYLLGFTEICAMLVFPASFGLSMVAPEAVPVILGPKWEAMIFPLQFISIFAALRLLSTLLSQVLIALHFAKFAMRVSLAALIIMPGAFWVAAGFGLSGVAIAWLMFPLITTLPCFLVVRKRLALPLSSYLRVLLPSLLGCVFMGLGIVGCRRVLDIGQFGPLGALLLLVAVGAIIYIGTLLLGFRSRVFRWFRFLMGIRRGSTSVGAVALLD